jgi:hypothetical protein
MAVAAQHGAIAAHIASHSTRIATASLHVSVPLESLGICSQHWGIFQHTARSLHALPVFLFVQLLRTMSCCVATRESSDGYRRRHELSTRRRSDGRAVVVLGMLAALAVVLMSVGSAGVCTATSRRAAVWCVLYVVAIGCTCGRCARRARQRRPSLSWCCAFDTSHCRCAGVLVSWSGWWLPRASARR